MSISETGPERFCLHKIKGGFLKRSKIISSEGPAIETECPVDPKKLLDEINQLAEESKSGWMRMKRSLS